jgi:hypothetical protein
MKSITVEDNSYFSFTHNETGIEIIWEFDFDNFRWQIVALKDDSKEIAYIPASAKPTSAGINQYDLDKLSETTIKMTNFLIKSLKLESEPPISK